MSTSEKRNELEEEGEFQKRIASGEIKYHSRDTVPEPDKSAPRNKLRFGGVFKSNPTLLIILVDIILVLLILLIVFPLIRPDSEVDDFEGYAFSLHGYLHEGAVHVSLVVQPNPTKIAETGEPLEIEFRVLESDTRIKTTFDTTDPVSRRDTQIVRERIELPPEYVDDEAVSVRASINDGEERVTLEKKMRQ